MRAHSHGRSYSLPLVLVLVLSGVLLLLNFSQYTRTHADESGVRSLPTTLDGRSSDGRSSERAPAPDECRTQTYPGGGLRSKTYYRDGRPHGAHRAWYPSGRLAEHGQYRFGEPIGPWVRYDMNGRLVEPDRND